MKKTKTYKTKSSFWLLLGCFREMFPWEDIFNLGASASASEFSDLTGVITKVLLM